MFIESTLLINAFVCGGRVECSSTSEGLILSAKELPLVSAKSALRMSSDLERAIESESNLAVCKTGDDPERDGSVGRDDWRMCPWETTELLLTDGMGVGAPLCWLKELEGPGRPSLVNGSQRRDGIRLLRNSDPSNGLRNSKDGRLWLELKPIFGSSELFQSVRLVLSSVADVKL